MNKSKKEISNIKSIKNNIYAIRTIWIINRSRVMNGAVLSALGYFEWVFYSAFFIRFLIYAIEKKSRFQDILIFILFTGLFFIMSNLYKSYVVNINYPLTSVKIYQGLYRKLYQKAINIELRCYEDTEFYNEYTMAIDSAEDKLTATVDNFFGVIFAAIASMTVFCTMFQIDHYAVCFVMFPLIGNFVFGGMMNKIYMNRYKDGVYYDRKAKYVERVMHLADYAKEMRLSNVYRLMTGKYLEAVDGTIGVANKYVKKSTIINWFQNFFTFPMMFEGVLLYGAYLAMARKTIALSDLAALSSVMVSFTWITIGLFNSLVECMKNGQFIQNLRNFLEYKEKIPEDYNGITPESNINSIEFRNVSFTYQQETQDEDGEVIEVKLKEAKTVKQAKQDNQAEQAKPTIKNLSFKIVGGSTVAFVGHNGAGKSTIIKLLFRLYDPTEGEILVNGRNIKEYSLRTYRQLFASAFQDFKILAYSIKDNVLMGRSYENEDDIVKDALKKAGVLDKVEQLKGGINTILTKEFEEDGAVLSGGQYQKTIVARAFAQDSPIKVFDEPSSALDPIAEYELFQSIMQESRDKTMIFISHRLSSVKNASMVFMLENGEIIESGTHAELIRMDGAYANMYRKQAKNYLAEDGYEAGEEEELN